MHQEPVPERAQNGRAELDGIWWPANPTPDGNGGGHRHASQPAPHIDDTAQNGAEEIWGARGLDRTPVARSVERPTSEEIWGPPRRASLADIPASESIWEDRATVATLTPTPSPVHRRPFVLPDAWAASPRRPRWRERLDSFGQLSRRTG